MALEYKLPKEDQDGHYIRQSPNFHAHKHLGALIGLSEHSRLVPTTRNPVMTFALIVYMNWVAKSQITNTITWSMYGWALQITVDLSGLRIIVIGFLWNEVAGKTLNLESRSNVRV